MIKTDELEHAQDSAADSALKARQRIETAVDAGELPVWVMEACAALERAAMTYGVTSERIRHRTALIADLPRPVVVH